MTASGSARWSGLPPDLPAVPGIDPGRVVCAKKKVAERRGKRSSDLGRIGGRSSGSLSIARLRDAVCELAHSCAGKTGLASGRSQPMCRELPMINAISLVTERAALAIDDFFDRVVLLAWTSTLRRHAGLDGGSILASPRERAPVKT
jgi:hypothetical protein